MIRSMTAFGSGRASAEAGTVTIEFRSVNSRFLDINLRMPDELRLAEGLLREMLGQSVKRGKVDIRVSAGRTDNARPLAIDPERLAIAAQQLQAARAIIPDVAPPRLTDLLAGESQETEDAGQAWLALCEQAAAQALEELVAAREREGQRLADTMRECAQVMQAIVSEVETALPGIVAEHQEKIATRLRDALQAANPDGWTAISGEELSARIAQEASMFGLRIDVAEELARLRSHVAELEHLLEKGEAGSGGKAGRSASVGKRLDFLFQEMNREANTLGSKAAALSMTRAAIDLKLLIEQLREQAQNIE